MPHVVIVNGPPFSGKDFLVKHFMERYKDKKVIWSRFKDVLYKQSYKRLCEKRNLKISLDQWISLCNDVKLKDLKLPNDLSVIDNWIASSLVYNTHYGDQLSPRNELIYESENVIKIEHGQGGVAVLTVEEIKKNPDWKDYVYFFSDGGFNVEIDVLYELMELESDDITIIRIDANGCSFDNDSREYINNPNFHLWNNKNEDFLTYVKSILYDHLDKTVNY